MTRRSSSFTLTATAPYPAVRPGPARGEGGVGGPMASTSPRSARSGGGRAAPATGHVAPTLARPAHVVLIESDPAGQHVLTAALAGHRVSHYAAVGDALPALRAAAPRLVVLGLRPAAEGRLVACSAVRGATAAPILLCAADRRELVLGFRLGADDVVQPPLEWEHLRARAEALVRRGHRGTGARGGLDGTPTAARLRAGPLTLDLPRLHASIGGAPVPLTRPELRLLMVLAERAGRAVSREELSRLALDQDHVTGSRAVDMHVRRLRRKLSDAAVRDGTGWITAHSVRGTGYCLEWGEAPA